VRKVGIALLKWIKKHERALSFRGGYARDPYHALVLAFMLQRTRAERVDQVYRIFLARYPTIERLAQADPEEVVRLFDELRLGMVRRGRFLVKAARAILERFDGQVPRRTEDLLSLPGVGPYIASVVRCAAYGEDDPIVDTAVLRVLRRLTGNPQLSLEEGKRVAQRLYPPGKALKLSIALIDLAALVCRSRNPRCYECPIRKYCKTFKRLPQDSISSPQF